MPRPNQNKIALIPKSLYLYQREMIWYCYLLKNGHRSRRSLKTTDINEAKIRAFEMYSQSAMNQDFKLIERTTRNFRHAVKAYRAKLIDRYGELKPHQANSLKFLALYFEDTPLTKIDTTLVRQYLNQRSHFWTTSKGRALKKRNRLSGSTNKETISGWTLKRETYVLRQLLRNEIRLGHFDNARMPDFETILIDIKKEHTADKREALTNSELTKISNWLRGDITRHQKDYERTGKKYHLQKVYQKGSLLLFQHLMHKLYLRPSEARRLCFNDLEITTNPDGREIVICKLRQDISKVRKSHVRFSLEASQLHDKSSVLWKHIQNHKQRLQQLRLVTDSTPIFLSPKQDKKDIRKLYDVSAAYNEYLKNKGILKTSYAIRHNAISRLIEMGIPTALVADLAGTSERVINSHYKQIAAEKIFNIGLQKMASYYGLTTSGEASD